MIDYSKILEIHFPEKSFTIVNNSYDDLIWNDNSEKPSKEVLENLWEATQIAIKKAECKLKAKKLISKTDWAMLPDNGLTNQKEYEIYRKALRNLIINPVAEPNFPLEPEPIWV